MADDTFTLAAVQAAPVFFDPEATAGKAVDLIAEAAAQGADLVVFGETWLPGYPWWVWGGGSAAFSQARVEYLAGAVRIPGPETDLLCRAAQEHEVDVVIGVAELDQSTLSSVYCTALTIGREGQILGRHRKLKPTDAERRAWADGDANGLRTYDRAYGRLSALNCWEHKMVLPGYALMAQGTQVHAALWPGSANEVQRLLSRSFAVQAGCYVVAASGIRRPEDVPERFADLRPITAGDGGGSYIIDPWGNVVVEADPSTETIITATGSLDRVLQTRVMSDNGGHYSRPDIFRLEVNAEPLQPIAFRGALGE